MGNISINMKLEGVQNVLDQMSKFDKNQRVALRAVVKKSSNRLRLAEKSRVHNVSGNLEKSIGTKYASDGLSSTVGPSKGKGSVAHLVEFGHIQVEGGKTVGHVPAHPFIVPSAEEEKPRYLEDIKKSVQSAIPSI